MSNLRLSYLQKVGGMFVQATPPPTQKSGGGGNTSPPPSPPGFTPVFILFLSHEMNPPLPFARLVQIPGRTMEPAARPDPYLHREETRTDRECEQDFLGAVAQPPIGHEAESHSHTHTHTLRYYFIVCVTIQAFG